LVGWKKLSHEIISFENESKAFEPPRYFFSFTRPFGPRAAEKYSATLLGEVPASGVPMGAEKGVEVPDTGAGALSGVIEYTIMRARDAKTRINLVIRIN
jgi:hypothetical protein